MEDGVRDTRPAITDYTKQHNTFTNGLLETGRQGDERRATIMGGREKQIRA